MDEAPDRAAQAAPRLRPRVARAAQAREPQGPGLRAPLRVGADPVRRQPFALPAGGRARPRAVQGHGPGGAFRLHGAAGGRRNSVLPDPWAAFLLLVLDAAESVGAAG